MRYHRPFRLTAATQDGGRNVLVLTRNLADIQPWREQAAHYQTRVYLADAAGLPTTTLVRDPIEHTSEEAARRSHYSLLRLLRSQTGEPDPAA
jgi:hypothetical protein